MEKTLNQVKTEILARLNIRTEYESLGIVLKGDPNSRGWIPCRSPYNQDKNPSCGINVSSSQERGYLCIFNDFGNGNGKSAGKPNQAFSLFDIAADFLPGANGDFKYTLKHYAEKTGVQFGSTRTPPTPEIIQAFIDALPPDAREHLNRKRGLSNESIAKYQIGFRASDIRNTFPVYDSDNTLVNIRYHNSKLKPKTLNQPGFGEARLWGADRLAKAPSGSIICVTAGEFDSMLLEQETGLISVSPTNGESAFSHAFVPLFHGHHVVLVRDCDEPGRRSVENVVLPAFQQSVTSGKIPSLKIVWLYPKNAPKEEKDFTDYIVKSGGSGAALLDLIKSTAPYKYSQEAIEDPPPDPDQFFDGKSFIAPEMVDYLLSRHTLFHDGATFFKYNKTKGVYAPTSNNLITRDIKRALGRRAKVKYMSDSASMLEADTYKTPDQLKTPPHLINMANGILDLKNSKFLPHTPKHLLKIQVPIKFDPSAECPRFLEFLDQIFPNDPGKHTALQDFSGYCFTHNISFEKCLFLIGNGANGKSVFMKVLSGIVGLENTTFLDPQMLADKFTLGSIKDKLLNIASEVSAREQIAAQIFNKVISGDCIQADVKYQREPLQFFPIAKHVFAMNEIPIVTDKSFAFERRVIVLRFNQTFTGARADYQLHSKLKSELPGIFNWALVGLNRIMENFTGIHESPRMLADKAVLMKQVRPVLAFAEERCEFHEDESVIKTDLYKEYVAWCEECSLRKLSRMKFYSQVLSSFQNVIDYKPQGTEPRILKGIGIKI